MSYANLRSRYSWARTRRLLAAVAVSPGILFAALFVQIQIVAHPLPVTITPARVGLAYETLALTAPDGTAIAAWFVPAARPQAPVIVLVHGLGSMRSDHVNELEWLHGAGFAVAMPDLRGHGESGGRRMSFGMDEALDVRAVVDAVRQRPGLAHVPIGVLGYSMGAVTALHAASLDARISAVVADSPFASLIQQARWRIGQIMGGRLERYFSVFAIGLGSAVLGHWPGDWDVSSWVAALGERPALFIHGSADTNIPVTCSRTLVQSAARGELWVVDGTNHIDARLAVRSAYVARVTAFFRRHLGAEVRCAL